MKPPIFHVITLFPEVIRIWLETSIMGRAVEKGLFEYQIYQLRDFTTDKHHTVDDVAYGGGGGMVLKVEPLVRAIESITSSLHREDYEVVYFSPKGEKLNVQFLENAYSQLKKNYLLVCGHYEGVDQRFIEGWVDREISLGDFVLTGGEIPALAFIDGLARHLDGVIGEETVVQTESFSLKDKEEKRLLEYPHYTRPYEFRGKKVPEILLSGDHKKVESWRMEKAFEITKKNRSDLA